MTSGVLAVTGFDLVLLDATEPVASNSIAHLAMVWTLGPFAKVFIFNIFLKAVRAIEGEFWFWK